MKNLILKTLSTAVAVMFTVYLLQSGVHMKENFLTALLLAVVLGVLNAVVKPLLILLTLPVTIFSFGLFLLAINAAIILIADTLLEERFDVDSFWWALLFSLIVSVISSIIQTVMIKDKIMDAEEPAEND